MCKWRLDSSVVLFLGIIILIQHRLNTEITLNTFALQPRVSLRFCRPAKYTGSLKSGRLRHDNENELTFDRAILRNL